MRYKKHLGGLCIVIGSAALIGGCSGKCQPSAAAPSNMVIAGWNGTVYQNGQILAGDKSIRSGMSFYENGSGFTSSEQFVSCGIGGVVMANNNSWNYIGQTSNNFYSNCVLFTQPLLNDNIYLGYNDSNESAYAYKYNGSTWLPISGGVLPERGSVYAVTSDLNGNVYVGLNTFNTGNWANVYTSKDNQWTKVTSSSLPDTSIINQIIVSSNNVLYVAANLSFSTGYVYTPSANNTSWDIVGGGAIPNNETINGMVTQSDTLFVSTINSLYTLNNNQWESITTPSSSIITALASANNNLYLAESNGNVYKYNNQNWVLLGGNLLDTLIGKLDISKNGTIVATTVGGDSFKLINGQWSPLVVGAVNYLMLSVTVNESTGTIYATGVESDNQSYVYSWNGNNWSKINNSAMPNNGLVRMTANDSKNNLYAASIGALLGSNYLVCSANKKNLLDNLRSNVDNFVYESMNGQWVAVNNESLPYSGIISSMLINKSTDKIYVSTTGMNGNDVLGYIFESVDGQWKILNNKPIVDTPAAVGPIAIDRNNNLYASTGGFFNDSFESTSSVYESKNGNWIQVNQAIPNNEQIMSMTFDANNKLFVGTRSGGDWFCLFYLNSAGNVYESKDGLWKIVNTPLPINSGGATSIQFDNNNNLFVSTMMGQVYESQVGQWVLINNYDMLSTSMQIY